MAEGGRERLGAGQQEDRFTELVGSGNEPEVAEGRSSSPGEGEVGQEECKGRGGEVGGVERRTLCSCKLWKLRMKWRIGLKRRPPGKRP